MRLLIIVVAVLAFTGQTLSVVAQTPAPDLESPGSILRITLGRLLSEHVFLVVEAMRTGASDGSSRAAVTDVLEANTVEIEAQVASIYGAPAGSSFVQIWRGHNVYLLDYAAA